MTSCTQPVIRIDKIKKAYGDQAVLKGVDLTMESGDFASIMGPSGAGKSTLINIVGLLDTFNEGSYAFENTDISNTNEEQRTRIRNERIGYIFQSYNLITGLSARDNILLPAYYYKKEVDEDHYMHLVTELGLKDLLHKKTALLSGGEKQRVSIARALINKPILLIADEPTGNLDEKNTEIVRNILLGLEERGVSILLVTHDSTLAKCAKKQYFLKNGLLSEDE